MTMSLDELATIYFEKVIKPIQYAIKGKLESAPVSEHPTIKQVRNKRHRKRLVKRYKRQGVSTFLRQSLKWKGKP